MSDSPGAVSIPGPTLEAPAASAATGTLAITTEPSSLAVEICDHQMAIVKQGVAPLQIELPAGTYLVRAARAGHRDLAALAVVSAGTGRSIRLSATAPTFLQSAVDTAGTLANRYIRRLPSAPGLLAPKAPSRASAPVRFHVRFRKLETWDEEVPVEIAAPPGRYENGTAILDVKNPQRRVVFAQIACENQAILNVALPLAGVSSTSCTLLVTATAKTLRAHVTLPSVESNSILQYMSQGYLDEAARVVAVGANPADSLFGKLARYIGRRIEDPSTALLSRYLTLRRGEATVWNTLGDSLLDVLDATPDGLVISAKVWAQQRNLRQAATVLLQIKAGRLPLFTEGFSMLIQLCRELLDLDDDAVPHEKRMTGEMRENLSRFFGALRKWAPFVDLTAPTVTFTGYRLVSPSTSRCESVPPAADGWMPGPTPPDPV